ncbi:hypothetical protein E3N88_22662 [Mikania micrantha]|uniref:DNA helicase Pif1-like 2B domain-containing protein n=1 Tax=Mikania micrantha TaxID=192012 RepID=A0A5N6NB30_9ASTR|nr:hypothetical protein E3N88_22662 [Mikania micrantha]
MRLNLENQSADLEKIKEFANWLLQLGEGNLGGINDGDTSIEISDDLLISNTTDPLATLIQFVYLSILQQFKDPEYFRERAILAPKNEFVQEINGRLLSLFTGNETEYLSSDSLCQTEQLNEAVQESLYSPDVLNGLKISGLPNHKLVLKVGVPVMLLRNID